MKNAEQAIEEDRLHLVSAVDADHAAKEAEHPLAEVAPLRPASDPEPDRAWSAENPDVVTFGQQAIQVYANQIGHIVIRQEQAWSDDADSYIYISPDILDRLIERLKAVKEEAKRP